MSHNPQQHAKGEASSSDGVPVARPDDFVAFPADLTADATFARTPRPPPSRKRKHHSHADRGERRANRFAPLGELSGSEGEGGSDGHDGDGGSTSKKRKRHNGDDGAHAVTRRHQADPSNGKDSKHGLGNGIDSPNADTNNKPRLVFAGTHRLNSMLKLGALQSLMLYCIADDPAPNFIAVHRHAQVRKAVVLMVPGLELGMFTSEIDLESKVKGRTETPGIEAVKEARNGSSIGEEGRVPDKTLGEAEETAHDLSKDAGFRTVGKNPDDYLPTELHADQLPTSLRPLAQTFDRVWPVKTPGDDRMNRLYSPVQAILSSSVSKGDKGDEKRSSRNLTGTPAKLERAPHRDQQSPQKPEGTNEHSAPITDFVLTSDDLRENDYPIHPACVAPADLDALMKRRQQNGQGPENGWRDSHVSDLSDGAILPTNIESGSVTAGRTVYTLDCEMCLAGEEYVLTRVSIVDWSGKIVLDELVKPDQPITNYLTQFSGITESMLADVTTSIRDIQDRLLTLITPHTILAGHSLESDLRALKLTHPFIVDTSIMYPHPVGPPLRSSLKFLSQKYLNRAIQQGHGASGHDSVEDARATLALIQLKCTKGTAFGNPASQMESVVRRISRARSRLEPGDARGLARRSGAIVDVGNPERTFFGMAPYLLGAEDDDGVAAGVCRAVQGDADGAYVPGGGVDFVWARLRALETARGWSAFGEKEKEKEKETEGGEEDDALENGTGQGATPPLSDHVIATVARIQAIRAMLPPCTLFIVYSGTGDAQELFRLQEKHRQFRREYAVKKWDELSVQWTDVEEQAIKRACGAGRTGMAMMTITG